MVKTLKNLSDKLGDIGITKAHQVAKKKKKMREKKKEVVI